MKITYTNRNVNKMGAQGWQSEVLQNIYRMCRDAFSPTERVRRSGKKFGKRKSEQRYIE